MELFLGDVRIKYICPKCNVPVGVYWWGSRFPIARMGIAFRKICSGHDCNRISMRITSVSGKIEREQVT